MNRGFKFIILALSLLAASCLLQATGFAQTQKNVRVAVLQDASSFGLKVLGPYEIIDSVSKKVLSSGHNLKTTVTTFRNMILMGSVSTNTPKIFIKTQGTEPIVIDGRRFRGNLELIKKDSGLVVVNHIELEDYIRGILYHEASHYWPMEALEAQAIVSRSYAVYEMQENKLRDFDLTSDTYSQVYGGSTSERERTNKAVDLTLGKIIMYRGEVIPAYFHATCGGHTEDASMLWNINLAPLKGVVCDFCKDSPHFNWHYVLTLKEIEQSLSAAGVKIKNLKDIAILGKDNSGRITDLNLVSPEKELKISAKDFRNIIGPNIIRSTNFTINIVKNDVVFEGFGWGHGVGLCQWGAYFMAKQGYTIEQILQYYYPGTDVKALRF
jgi:stage II sporulation protein D